MFPRFNRTAKIWTDANNPPARRRLAFTLIELVAVLLIIAIIAGLAIPQVAMLGRSADMAASAKTQADLASNIQLYFMLQKRYPRGMDSLITSGGAAIYASDTNDATTQTHGLPYAGADGTRMQNELSVAALTGNYSRSFTRAGFEFLYDHDTTAGVNSNNSGTVQRLLSASPVNVAEVNGTGPLAAKLVPNGLTATQRLVAVGIGPRNDAVSKTIINCPTYPGADGRYYGRYIAVFMIYETGERATLVGVVDSYGRHSDYTIQQFNESLPDGSRQG